MLLFETDFVGLEEDHEKLAEIFSLNEDSLEGDLSSMAESKSVRNSLDGRSELGVVEGDGLEKVVRDGEEKSWWRVDDEFVQTVGSF